MKKEKLLLEEINGHNRRVTQISGILAEEAGFPDRFSVEICALLHDIGKEFVPADILGKDGKLTSKEFSEIKKHTALGFLTLLNAAVTALFHHEKWDGSGYCGLSGGKIPPLARLVAVADVFDALMSKRSYKSGWSFNETLEHMKSESGKHFDPAWINTLVSCEDKIAALYIEKPDEQSA